MARTTLEKRIVNGKNWKSHLACLSLLIALSGCSDTGGSSKSKPVKTTLLVFSGRNYEATLEKESDTQFRFEIKNVSGRSMIVQSYYFGYTLDIHYRDGSHKTRDFGDDKVPVPTINDWHLLRPGQSLGWLVELPSSFPSLDLASEVRYYESPVALTVPEHITREVGSKERVVIDAKWPG